MSRRRASPDGRILIATLVLSAGWPGAITGQAADLPAIERERGATRMPERLTPFGSRFPAPPPGMPVVGTPSQAARLPVLDNEGREISRSEIEAHVDRSGGMGMLLGGLGGMVIGSLVGTVIASSVGCSREQGLVGLYDNCSPQEQALRSAWLTGGIATGLIGFGYLGWEVDRNTWWEVVRAIRRERSRALLANGSPEGYR